MRTTSQGSALAAAVLLCGCTVAQREERWTQPAAPARPAACAEVAPGGKGALQAAVDAAPSGAALCLLPGVHLGPVLLNKSVTLWGPRAASIASDGTGTTVVLSAEGAALLGVTIDGSGGHYDTTDAGVRGTGKGLRIEGVRVVRATFGIALDQTEGAVVRGNEIDGDSSTTIGMRGDSIRLWEAHRSLVEGNHVRRGRDLVVWYSPGSIIRGNLVEESRYGTHFMFSSGCVAEDNRYLGDVVGIFVMYSRDLVIRRNLLAGSSGAAGMGLGLKESGGITVENNRFVRDTVGLYLDTSPLQDEDKNLFSGNELAQAEVAIQFLAPRTGNTFTGNRLHDNGAQVTVEGGGGLAGQQADGSWDGNDWDDYAGYDLDGDGIGDVPYELRSLSGELTARTPELLLLRGTPALAMVDAVSHLVPLWPSQLVLVDHRPRVFTTASRETDHAR